MPSSDRLTADFSALQSKKQHIHNQFNLPKSRVPSSIVDPVFIVYRYVILVHSSCRNDNSLQQSHCREPLRVGHVVWLHTRLGDGMLHATITKKWTALGCAWFVDFCYWTRSNEYVLHAVRRANQLSSNSIVECRYQDCYCLLCSLSWPCSENAMMYKNDATHCRPLDNGHPITQKGATRFRATFERQMPSSQGIASCPRHHMSFSEKSPLLLHKRDLTLTPTIAITSPLPTTAELCTSSQKLKSKTLPLHAVSQRYSHASRRVWPR